jgi:peptidoglycan lytic transglycosylase
MKLSTFLLIIPLAILLGCATSTQQSAPQSNKTFFTPRNWQIPIAKGQEKPAANAQPKPVEPVVKIKEKPVPPPSVEVAVVPPEVKPAPVDEQMTGFASWYGPGFQGEKTANGEKYDQNELTAAHKLLPMNTWVQVTNMENNKTVIVRINDRGPFKKDRVIDVTRKAAEVLEFKEQGTARVSLKVTQYPKDYDPSKGLKPYKQVVIQVAAFSTQQRADSFKLQLSQKYTKIPFLIEIKNDHFYVLAGPYDQKTEAEQVGAALKKEGFENFVRSYKK